MDKEFDSATYDEMRYDLSVELNNNPSLIRFVKKKFATDDMWDFCIEKDSTLFKYRKNPSYSFCIKALKLDGSNIRYIPNTRKHPMLCQELCEIAVRSSPRAILVIPNQYVTGDLIHLACDLDATLMLHYNIDEPYAMARIQENPSIIQYLKNPSDLMKMTAIRKDPSTALLIPKKDWTLDMLNQLRRDYPEYANSIQISEEDIKNNQID